MNFILDAGVLMSNFFTHFPKVFILDKALIKFESIESIFFIKYHSQALKPLRHGAEGNFDFDYFSPSKVSAEACAAAIFFIGA